MSNDRYLKESIQNDALRFHKIAFIGGPRQVGKTTLAKSLLIQKENYFNWDAPQFRKAWAKNPDGAIANRGDGPILLDEIHKDRQWKNRLKGIYDTHSEDLPIIVTGSARMDYYRKGKDSLMGRHLPYRLHPFSVNESLNSPKPDQVLSHSGQARFQWGDLLRLSGFPEPLLRGTESHAKRWSRLRLDRLVLEDSRDLRAISDLGSFRLLTDLLPERVGSLLSINSLREDVSVAYATVRAWVQLLEMLYYCFLIKPYSKSLKRALVSEPKLYLFDILQIPQENVGARRENLTALHLLKSCQFWTDTAEGYFELQYLRNKDKREVDFVVVRDKKPWILIECKSNSKSLSDNLVFYSGHLKTEHNFQLVDGPKYHRRYNDTKIEVIDYESFFSRWC